MGEVWHWRTERLVQQYLLVCVGEMVLSADHMRDSHLDVVNYYRQVIKRSVERLRSGVPWFDAMNALGDV